MKIWILNNNGCNNSYRVLHNNKKVLEIYSKHTADCNHECSDITVLLFCTDTNICKMPYQLNQISLVILALHSYQPNDCVHGFVSWVMILKIMIDHNTMMLHHAR